jgi:hypothetical protein
MGEIIVIEMQIIMEINYYGRMLSGASRIIVERMITSEIYRKIKKVYSINIVYFDLGQGKDYVYHGKTDFRGLHNQDLLQLSEKQRTIFGAIEVDNIETEYYIVKVENFGNIIKSPLDEWIYFIKNERIEQGFNAQGMFEALNVLDYNRLSPEDRKSFDYLQNEQSHYRSELASARDEGEMKARKEFAKAIEERRKAIEERRKAIEEKDKLIEKLLQEKAKLKQSLKLN